MASSRDYPVNFVKQPPKEIPAECSICFEVLCRPKLVSCCGHSFCAVCIGRVASSHKLCPLCGQKFTLIDNKWLERTLNGYDVATLSTPGEGMQVDRRAGTTQTSHQR